MSVAITQNKDDHENVVLLVNVEVEKQFDSDCSLHIRFLYPGMRSPQMVALTNVEPDF